MSFLYNSFEILFRNSTRESQVFHMITVFQYEFTILDRFEILFRVSIREPQEFHGITFEFEFEFIIVYLE